MNPIVSETYFFREPKTFEAFEGKILGALQAERTAKEKKRLKIWSAGCSTGEEPYSIAIALRRRIPDLGDWQVTILASDVDVKILEAARAARYGEWSFRQAPGWLKKTYFHELQNRRYELREELRGMVEFFRLDLVADAYPNPAQRTDDVDVIFCRNVLMYFSAEQVARVVDGFRSALHAGGYLIVAPAEASTRFFSEFEAVNLDGVTLYRKPAAVVAPTIKIPAFERAPRSAPPKPARNEPEALPDAASMARTCADQGRREEALAWCVRGLSAEPLDASLRYLRAMILQENGQHDEAIRELERVLYLDPRFAIAHFAIAGLLRARRRVRESKRHLRAAQSLIEGCAGGELIAESEGVSAGHLRAMIRTMLKRSA